MARGRLAAAVLALAVAGCGEIPQPFRHDGPPPALTRPKMARGITVRPVAAVPDGDRLAEAVVKALEVHEVPAVVRGGPAFGHVLEAEEQPHGLVWVLRSPDGESAPIRTQALPAGTPDAMRMRREAEAVAAALAARLADPDAAPAPEAAARPAVVGLKPFAGLPGDGDASLTRAVRQALERGGLLVADGGGDYMVEGKVTTIPGLPGEETVVVAWTIRDKAGAELATIEQEGVVPRGRLAGSWGPLARDVAEGGAAGVLEVIAEARRRQ